MRIGEIDTVLKTKTKPELTLEERSASALAIHESAVSAFRLTADDLELAANEHAAIAADAQAEIDRLIVLRDNAVLDEEESRGGANKIRELIGG
jgi:hypothetical protein